MTEQTENVGESSAASYRNKGRIGGERSDELVREVGEKFVPVVASERDDDVIDQISFVQSLTRIISKNLNFTAGVAEISLKSLLSLWDSAEAVVGQAVSKTSYVRIGAARLMVLALLDTHVYQQEGHNFSISLEMIDNRFLTGTVIVRQVVSLVGATDIWFSMNHSVAYHDAGFYIFKITVYRNGKIFQPAKADAAVAQMIFVPLLRITGIAENYKRVTFKPVVVPLGDEHLGDSMRLIKTAAADTRKFIKTGGYAKIARTSAVKPYVALKMPAGDVVQFTIEEGATLRTLKKYLSNRGVKNYSVTHGGKFIVLNDEPLMTYLGSELVVSIIAAVTGVVHIRGVEGTNRVEVAADLSAYKFMELIGLNPKLSFLVCEGKVVKSMGSCFDKTVEVRHRQKGGSPDGGTLLGKLIGRGTKVVGLSYSETVPIRRPGTPRPELRTKSWTFGSKTSWLAEVLPESPEELKRMEAIDRNLQWVLGTSPSGSNVGMFSSVLDIDRKTIMGASIGNVELVGMGVTKFVDIKDYTTVGDLLFPFGLTSDVAYLVCEGKVVSDCSMLSGKRAEVRLRTLGGVWITPDDSVSCISAKTSSSSRVSRGSTSTGASRSTVRRVGSWVEANSQVRPSKTVFVYDNDSTVSSRASTTSGKTSVSHSSRTSTSVGTSTSKGKFLDADNLPSVAMSHEGMLAYARNENARALGDLMNREFGRDSSNTQGRVVKATQSTEKIVNRRTGDVTVRVSRTLDFSRE